MELIYESNRIYGRNDTGELIAEVTFPTIDATTVDIDHTFVDQSLRGQGVANQLLLAAAEHIRAQGKKAVLTCSYAVRWFETHPEHSHLLKG